MLTGGVNTEKARKKGRGRWLLIGNPWLEGKALRVKGTAGQVPLSGGKSRGFEARRGPFIADLSDFREVARASIQLRAAADPLSTWWPVREVINSGWYSGLDPAAINAGLVELRARGVINTVGQGVDGGLQPRAYTHEEQGLAQAFQGVNWDPLDSALGSAEWSRRKWFDGLPPAMRFAPVGLLAVEPGTWVALRQWRDALIQWARRVDGCLRWDGRHVVIGLRPDTSLHVITDLSLLSPRGHIFRDLWHSNLSCPRILLGDLLDGESRLLQLGRHLRTPGQRRVPWCEAVTWSETWDEGRKQAQANGWLDERLERVDLAETTRGNLYSTLYHANRSSKHVVLVGSRDHERALMGTTFKGNRPRTTLRRILLVHT